MRLLFALLVLVPGLCWGQMPAGGSGSGGSKGDPAKWSDPGQGVNKEIDGQGTFQRRAPVESAADYDVTWDGPNRAFGTTNGSTTEQRPFPCFTDQVGDATYNTFCDNGSSCWAPCDATGNLKPVDYSETVTAAWLVDTAEAGGIVPDEGAGANDHAATERGTPALVYGTAGGPAGMQADGRVADATVQDGERLEVESNQSTLIGPSWVFHKAINPGAFTTTTSRIGLQRFGAFQNNWTRISYDTTAGDIEVRTDDGTTETVTNCGTVALSTSTWAHITLICEATAAAPGPLYCFKDGTLVNTVTDGCRSMGTPTADMIFGDVTDGWGLDSGEAGDTSTLHHNVVWDVCDQEGDCRSEWTNAKVCSIANHDLNGQSDYSLGC